MSIDLGSGFDELLSGLSQISSQAEESVSEDQLTKLAEGEVRNCAVLFADIKGFTALSEKLHAEEVKLIIDHTFKIFSQEIKRFNGLVDKYIGDCIMAVFGSEVAGDNDSELAIRAGLAMLDRLEQINTLLRSKGIELGLRVGINYGEVVYGVVGEGREKDTTVMGDTVNTAQRMESNAPVNSILVTGGTRKYLGDIFTYEDLPPIMVKNKAEPVPVAVVKAVNPGTRERWHRSSLTGRTKFVGRQAELVTLDLAYDAASCGETGNRLILIKGAPGIGKSRFVYEFRHELANNAKSGVTVLKTGNPSYTTRPYYAVVELLRQYWGIDEFESGQEAKVKLENGLAALAGGTADGDRLAGAAPIIGNLLGLSYDDPRLKMDAASLEAERRIALKNVFLALFEVESSDKGTSPVIIVDDVQWADEGSLSAILHLAEDVRPARPLFICTMARSDAPAPAGWSEFDGFSTMELGPLSKSDCGLVLSSMLDGLPLPEKLVTLLAERSQGNPFFLEEIVHLLIERRIFAKTDDRWMVAARLDALDIPVSVHSIVLSRIDRLDRDVKDLLQKASVIGMEFMFAVIERILVKTVRGHDPEAAREILHSLSDKQLVFAADGSDADEEKYFFRNMLIQEAAYKTLLRTNRKILHALAAEAIESIYAGRIEDFYSTLAFHYERCENFAKASDYYERAGKRFADMSKFAGAKSMFASAIECVVRANLPGDEKTRKEIELGICLLETMNSLGLYSEGLEIAEQALDKALSSGTKAHLAKLYRVLGVFKANLGDIEAGLSLQQKARELCREIGDERTLGRILLTLGRISERRNKWEEAKAYLEEALCASKDGGDRALEGSVYLNQGVLLMNGGRLSEADSAFVRALSVFEELGDRLGKVRANSNMGIIAAMQGRYGAAREYYERGIEIVKDIGNRAEEANMLLNLGQVCLEQGDLEDAAEHASQACDIYRDIGNVEMEGVALGSMGVAEERLGHMPKALLLAKQSLELAQKCGNAPEIGLRMTYVGRYSATAPDGASALEILREGLSILGEAGIAEYAVEGKLNLAQALLAIGKTDEAQAELDCVIVQAGESGLSGLAAMARGLLARIVSNIAG